MLINRLRGIPFGLAALAVALLLGVPATAQSFGPGITGETAKMVGVENGAFVQVRSDRWIEIARGETDAAFQFTLKRRSPEVIELYDTGRDVRLFLVLSERQVYYKQGDQDAFRLYEIISASNESRVPWHNASFESVPTRQNQPSYVVAEEVYENEVLLSGNKVEVTVNLYCKETTDVGEDEVFWELTSPTGKKYRSPGSGWRDMDEDDSDLERWVSSVSAEIDTSDVSKSFTLKVWEVDDGANSDDLLFSKTLVPVEDISTGRISLTGSASSEYYNLSYTIVDRRVEETVSKTQILSIQSFEKSPTVPDAIALLHRISGKASTVVDVDIPGIEDRWGDFVGNGDHLQGITMTTSGQLAVNMSLSGQPGVFAYSESIYGLGAGEDLRWKFLQTAEDGSDLWDPHPSAMASTGQIVAVSNKNTPLRFVFLPSDFGDAVHLDYLTTGISASRLKAEGVAIAYHPVEDRFYATWMMPGVTPGDAKSTLSIPIYASTPGVSLLDKTNRFRKIADVGNVPVASQGLSMIVEDSGEIYLAANFNSDGEPPTADYAGACATEYLAITTTLSVTPAVVVTGPLMAAQIAAAAQAAERFPFTDVLTVSRIGGVRNGNVEFLSAADVKIDRKELGRTQPDQFCVLHRPSWRFGGSIVPTGPNELTALWGGRWNTVTDPLSDNVEYAIHRVRK